MFSYFYENYELSSFDDNINSSSNLEIGKINYNDISDILYLNEPNLLGENQKLEYSFFNNNSYSMCNLTKQNTKWDTLKKSNAFSPEHNKEDDDDSNCKLVSFDEIKDILTNKKFSEICQKLIKNKNIEETEYRLTNKKRRREKESFVFFKNEKETGEKIKNRKRGRKIKEGNQNPYRMEHNKNADDNIIKKIKAKILLYPLLFLNKILERNNIFTLCKLDYQYINQIKKEEDLKFLKMSLKDLYSLEVSSKYKRISKNYNKDLINSIIKNKRIEDYSTIMFAFNLKFEDWMELFSYKKNINDMIKKYKGIDYVNKEIIENNIIGVENLLTKIADNNDENYFSIFTYLLYNYKRWFLIKSERYKKKNNFDLSN